MELDNGKGRKCAIQNGFRSFIPIPFLFFRLFLFFLLFLFLLLHRIKRGGSGRGESTITLRDFIKKLAYLIA